MTASRARASSVLIIANSAAGAVTSDRVLEVLDVCARHCDEVTVQWVGRERQERVEGRVVEGLARADLVVSVGGDGTAHWTARQIVGAADRAEDRPALFVVPFGTGNSNYRNLWGDRPWQGILRAAVTQPRLMVRHLDMARVVETGELILLGAGSGLVADVLLLARGIEATGRARYQAAVERSALTHTPYQGRVLVDGVEIQHGKTMLVNVGGGRYRAWQYDLLPHAEPDDGLLDVCVLGDSADPAALPELLRHGLHVEQPGSAYARGREVVVERTDGNPLLFEHDGELRPATGARVTVELLEGILPTLSGKAPHVGD
ncbi:diacylglycerol kinase family protein [Streptomyces sp. NRRL B-24085]|uniref:diacylglycerol/lipid kinase family protein n=1 Tax=Streptomyces sp. NRRL B-24085 TaxID=1709476 RepID=UPI0006B2F318|nr:diacylglycerol kinase family protein [Streptomyces sp. NRRL B-24085]